MTPICGTMGRNMRPEGPQEQKSGGWKAPLSLGSEDSDGCGPATVRRRGGLQKGNRQLAPGDTIHHSRGHKGD